jgi:ABC-type molybdate transport system substrate-binding protein
MRRLAALLLLTALAGTASAQGAVVAAAANVKFALDEIARAFRRSTGHEVRIAYGSTGNLAQQIGNGAPFEVFVSADEATVERLAATACGLRPLVCSRSLRWSLSGRIISPSRDPIRSRSAGRPA